MLKTLRLVFQSLVNTGNKLLIVVFVPYLVGTGFFFAFIFVNIFLFKYYFVNLRIERNL